MPSTNTTFAVPRERGHQLRVLAMSKRISVAELVGNWIDRELRETDLPNEYEPINVSIHEEAGKVTFVVELFGQHTISMSPEQALSLAATFASVIDHGGTHLNADAEWVTVHKQGTGIIIEHEQFRRSMPVYVASAIAKELREAGEEYTKQAA